MASRIRLLLRKPDPEKRAIVEALGYPVDDGPLGSSSLKEFRENPPAALVIDLSRVPSHGQEVGVALRRSPATRFIPLVFVEGLPEKVERVQSVLPDARYTVYAKLGPVLEDVLRAAPKEVVVPKSLSGFDSPTPLVKKLGVKETVALTGAPAGFAERLPGVRVAAKAPLTIWFVETRGEFEKALPRMKACAEMGGLWICWPKGRKDGLNGNVVREVCLSIGLVDFKICAIDETWSGMRFAVRKPRG
ncbi:MAG: hypothetical protein FJW30_03320 [Acidobacteria bacterium]|nr:hypothetical protein [Acidobacteriota bacterium]